MAALMRLPVVVAVLVLVDPGGGERRLGIDPAATINARHADLGPGQRASLGHGQHAGIGHGHHTGHFHISAAAIARRMARVRRVAPLAMLNTAVFLLGWQAKHLPENNIALETGESAVDTSSAVDTGGVDVNKAFEYIDSGSDGVINRKEFMEVAAGTAARMKLDEDEGVLMRWTELTGRLFDNCDINGDGTLSKSEFEYASYLSRAARLANVAKSTIQLSGPPGEVFFLPEAAQEFSMMDTNADRKVDRSEFDAAARERFGVWGFDVNDETLLADLDAVFHKADTDSDGALGLREMQFSLFLFGTYGVHEMTRAVFWDMDLDDDGLLEWEEVVIGAEASAARGGPQGGKSLADHMHDHFAEGDIDRDGRLSQMEVVRILSGMLDGSAAPLELPF